jgi:transcriptional regulator with XRE-family HTH domain
MARLIDSPMQIGQVIRSLREEKGWSQEASAHEAGVGTTCVSRIERGDRQLSTSKLNALAAALGTSATAIDYPCVALELERARLKRTSFAMKLVAAYACSACAGA